MKYRLLDVLVCPSCRQGRFTVECQKESTQRIWEGHFTSAESQIAGINWDTMQETEVEEGILHCGSCSHTFPIANGIPRMLLDTTTSTPNSAHRHTRVDQMTDISAWQQNFDQLQTPLCKEDFLGKRVLDIGCGYGRHVYFAARYGAEVFAVDIGEDAVLSTQENTRQFQHVHVIQADAAHLPIQDESMDHVYSYGVLHHVDNADELLKEAHRTVKAGGSFGIWVYGPRQGFTLLINNALRGMTNHMGHDELLNFSRVLARGIRVGSHTPYKMFNMVPIGHGIVSHLPLHDHHKWPFDVVVADIYDRLRVPVKRWFRGEELQSWFVEHGYANCNVRRIVGNNETFAAFGTKR